MNTFVYSPENITPYHNVKPLRLTTDTLKTPAKTPLGSIKSPCKSPGAKTKGESPLPPKTPIKIDANGKFKKKLLFCKVKSCLQQRVHVKSPRFENRQCSQQRRTKLTDDSLQPPVPIMQSNIVKLY